MAVLLIAEDDKDFADLLARIFREAGHEVSEATDGPSAIELIHSRKYDVIISDLKLPGSTGMDILHEAKFLSPDTEFIVMTAFGSLEAGARVLREGASDYLQKPFSIPELQMRVERALRHRHLAKEVAYLRHEQDVIYRFEDIVGRSEGISSVIAAAKAAAAADGPVLLRGETGTGRQLLAGAIHFNSARRDRGFVRVLCSGVRREYLESDLFGHVAQAFPGADQPRVGRLEQANGGTVFLEDIGDMPLETQDILLGCMANGTFHRVGGKRDVSVNIRFMASTRRDLQKAVEEGRFRPELASRLSGTVIEIPPLRDRGGDVPLLANYLLGLVRSEMDRPHAEGFSARALRKLAGYAWPGNVQELRNVIERAILNVKGASVDAGDIQLPGDRPAGTVGLTDMQLSDLEKEAVLEALRKTDFVQKEAAKLLGISKRVIHYKIQQFGIKHPRWIKNR